MTMSRPTRQKLQLFSRATAPTLKESGAMLPAEVDDAGRSAAELLAAADGSVIKLLFGDPDGPDDGGMSLTWARFGANFPLPRHSHSVDCVYYVVAGELRMGSQTLVAGDGFFIAA